MSMWGNKYKEEGMSWAESRRRKYDEDEGMSWAESRRRKYDEEKTGLSYDDKQRIAREIASGETSGLFNRDEEINSMVKKIKDNE